MAEALAASPSHPYEGNRRGTVSRATRDDSATRRDEGCEGVRAVKESTIGCARLRRHGQFIGGRPQTPWPSATPWPTAPADHPTTRQPKWLGASSNLVEREAQRALSARIRLSGASCGAV